MDQGWTSLRVKRLRGLWAEGLSTAHIAALLGISRNAVIGKANRLHLPARIPGVRYDLGYRETPRA